MNHNRQNKIALINDLSGFGRCSLTVFLPIVSYLQVQCCPVPTSILSNHTGFPEYFFDDYTDKLPSYIDNWRKLNLNFSSIVAGFMGSAEQMNITRDFIRDFRTDQTIVILDPVMGDHGRLYATYDETMCRKLRELVCFADILTPNLTEACNLTGAAYRDQGWKKSELRAMAGELCAMGPDRVVITGIETGAYVGDYVYERESGGHLLRTRRAGSQRSGTGDVYTAVIAADAVNGVEFIRSVKRASTFVKKCILRSDEIGLPLTDGVCFEELLHTLPLR